MATKSATQSAPKRTVNPYEKESIGSKALRPVKDEAEEDLRELWRQMFGGESDSPKKAQAEHEQPEKIIGGDLAIGVELKLSKKTTVEHAMVPGKKETHAEAGIEYHTDIIRSSERLSKHETRELQQKLKEIQEELQRLIESSGFLQMEFAEFAVDQTPTSPGKYHLNFFEWVLGVLRSARQKVEDSGSWLAAVGSKKKQRGYWSQAKSKGTSFTQNNERTVATQTG